MIILGWGVMVCIRNCIGYSTKLQLTCTGSEPGFFFFFWFVSLLSFFYSFLTVAVKSKRRLCLSATHFFRPLVSCMSCSIYSSQRRRADPHPYTRGISSPARLPWQHERSSGLTFDLQGCTYELTASDFQERLVIATRVESSFYFCITPTGTSSFSSHALSKPDLNSDSTFSDLLQPCRREKYTKRHCGRKIVFVCCVDAFHPGGILIAIDSPDKGLSYLIIANPT